MPLAKFKEIYLSLNAQSRRFLSIGFAVIIIILSYMFILEPAYKSQIAVRTDIKSKQDIYEESIANIARKGMLNERLKTHEARLNELEAKFLPGDKPPVAAAELQKMLKAMATDSGIDIKAERVISSEGKGGYIEVPVEIEFETQIAKLKNFIFGIENAPNTLFITGLRIRVTNVPDPKDIYVTMNIEGIIKGVLEKQK